MKRNTELLTQYQIRRALSIVIVALSLCCLGLSLAPNVFGVSPPPDGGYAGGNTAEGTNALFNLTTGGYNTTVGYFSLFANTAGSFNTALGAGALDLNNAGFNTGVGAAALLLNANGSDNTAVGTGALVYNDSGDDNTAVGSFAGSNITGGVRNVVLGAGAGSEITTEGDIIAIGAFVSGISTPFGEVGNSCYIGNIYGEPVDANDYAIVVVDGDGKLGTFAMGANGNKVISKGIQSPAELNRKIENLQATVAQQQEQIKALTAQLKEQGRQIQMAGGRSK